MEAQGHSYTTTLCVRRPREPGRFSGTVVAETLHAHGIAPIWMYCHPYLMRSGHGWVEITSQKVALDAHVKPSNAERYGPLHIEGPDTPFDLQPSFEDTEKRARFWAELERRNRASNDILAQVGAAIRRSSPFQGWPVARVILAGHSQTGSVTTRFILEAHAAQRLADGSPVFDGFFPSGFPAEAFAGCDVPIVQVLSEGDVSRPDFAFCPGHEGRRYRRDDSDDPADRFRLYELAGVPHMGTRHPPYDDVKLWQAQFPGVDGIPPGVRMNSLPHNELFNTALHHLVQWVAEGVAPPRAERLELGPAGFFVKDDHGNTRGGVRCVQLDVPRARYFPNPLNSDGTPRSFTVGGEEPLDDAELRKLYASSADYIERFSRRLEELVAEGWLLADDAEEMRREALKAAVR